MGKLRTDDKRLNSTLRHLTRTGNKPFIHLKILATNQLDLTRADGDLEMADVLVT